ncbi:MAG: diguanylate cyclase domain-containing protein, partial [Chloroflexota bacterium]
MDRPARHFSVPGGVSAVWLFGGALFLAVLAVAGVGGAVPELVGPTVVLAAAALGMVVGAAVVLLRRLRDTGVSLEQTSREADETATQLRVLIEHVPAAIYIDMADPAVPDGGRLAYMSPQITGILGYRPEEFLDDPELWPGLIHPDDHAAAIAAYEHHWRTGEPLRAEYRMIARDGSEVWVRDEAYTMPDDTRSGHQVSQGLLVDTTDRKRLESRLIHDALHDPLTGLANRVLVRDHLERALARHRRSPGSVALLFVDLDDFKPVNDSFGHAAGDEILCQVAARLVESVRADDVVGRQSGDEFAVLLDQVQGDEEAAAAAERILRELRRPIQLGGRSVTVGGSIGIAVGADRTATAEEMLLRADAAMYAAKAAGKGTFAIFDQ